MEEVRLKKRRLRGNRLFFAKSTSAAKSADTSITVGGIFTIYIEKWELKEWV
jgi:hypothetical protein